jgi:TBC1 domain family member 2
MTARPPPARPHISHLHPSHLSHSISEWGEDDVWDSASDEESPSHTWSRSSLPSATKTTTPKPVPEARASSDNNNSSSALAFSYTHVTVPSPSSYTSKVEPGESATDMVPSKSDWTFVVKKQSGVDIARNTEQESERGADADVEEMVFGDLDTDSDFIDMPIVKTHAELGVVRRDAEQIAKGAHTLIFTCKVWLICIDPLYLVRGTTQRGETPVHSRASSPSFDRPPERLARERSIKTSRRNKLMDCLLKDAIDMGECLDSPNTAFYLWA